MSAASRVAALWALHRAAAAEVVTGADVEPRPARFAHLRLRTSRLEPMQTFYRETLGFPVAPSSDGAGFIVTAGESNLEFLQDRTEEAFYHFAINVPENQFVEAKSWLAQRTTLLCDSETGDDELFFSSWNAHAVYFADPAGNVGELIARHTLPIRRTGGFSPASMLHVSEIGLVSADPDALAEQIMTRFGLSKYGPTSFFVGDELGLFILPPTGRSWIPERRQLATTYPVEVKLRGPEGPLDLESPPFVISVEAAGAVDAGDATR